ncbi:MAG: class I SAM-dependent methyltransferase [Pseudomonadota bacterium]
MAFVTPLLLPFENGDLDIPEGRGLFLNAELPQGVDHADWRDRITCVQPWRDRFLSLASARYETADKLSDKQDGFAFAFVALGKHRAEAQANIATAMSSVLPGGPIVIGGHKKIGSASIKKWVAERTEIVGSFSKSHWQVFITHASADRPFDVPVKPAPLDGFETAPGMFSHQEIDPGSKMLADHLPDDDLGQLADFGCGWGLLSVEALRRGQAESVALIDAHAASLEAAERNVLAHHPGANISMHWLDLAQEMPPKGFDTIVMNPPFHTERMTNVDLGLAFIQKASQALKPGGRMFMVANRQLPYEDLLAKSFKRVTAVQSDSRFKVFAVFR